MGECSSADPLIVPLPGVDGSNSKILAEYIKKGLTGKDYKDILKKFPFHFKEDEAIGERLHQAEALSNEIYRGFMAYPECAPVERRIEKDDPAHGFSHVRRVEKIVKYFMGKDQALLHDPIFTYFAPSLFSSIRFHDISEVAMGEKKDHDAVSALFVLSYFMHPETFRQVQNFTAEHPESPNIGYDDWIRLSYATAFGCLHHSKPEYMPDIGHMKKNGVFDPKELLLRVENIAKKQGKEDIFALFPQFSIVRNQLMIIRDGNLPAPIFTDKLLEGVIKQARFLSAADKFDSNYPPDLAAARTFLTMPDRKFFTSAPPDMNIKEEYQWRKNNGEEIAQCDFNRILFELTRVKTFQDLSPIVSYKFREALQDRGKFMRKEITRFINGDKDAFLQGYESEERKMINVLLSRVGASFQDIASITDGNILRDATRTLLKKQGYDDGLLDEALFSWRLEQMEVEEVIRKKYVSSQKDGYTNSEIVHHINVLFDMALQEQEQSMLKFSGPIKKDEIYDVYNGWVKTMPLDPWKIVK